MVTCSTQDSRLFAGLPKAAVVTHLQSLKAAAGFWAFGGTQEDVVYIPLPLYHSAASLIGVGGTVELGRPLRFRSLATSTLALRANCFSESGFRKRAKQKGCVRSS